MCEREIDIYISEFALLWENVVFGFFNNSMKKHFYNKFDIDKFIHKCIFSSKKPYTVVFLENIEQ